MYLNDNPSPSPVGTTAHITAPQQTQRGAYAEADQRYQRAWANLDYAAMGMAALDMRDILQELAIAQGAMFAYS
jgi:hypothetical protein